MDNIVTNNYIIIGSSVNVYTEILNDNIAMIDSSSTLQTYKKEQILKANCTYKINGENTERSITVNVGVLNTLISILYAETNKIIPTEYIKGESFTKEQIIDALKSEIDSFIDGFKLENEFNRRTALSEADYAKLFRPEPLFKN